MSHRFPQTERDLQSDHKKNGWMFSFMAVGETVFLCFRAFPLISISRRVHFLGKMQNMSPKSLEINIFHSSRVHRDRTSSPLSIPLTLYCFYTIKPSFGSSKFYKTPLWILTWKPVLSCLNILTRPDNPGCDMSMVS